MKKMILFLMLTLMLPMLAYADPWLVCDPYPIGEKPDYFIVTFNNVPQPQIAYQEQVMSDGNTYALLMDLAGIPEGNLNFTATAHNIWGPSDPSDPYQAVKKLPGKPLNMDLKKQ